MDGFGLTVLHHNFFWHYGIVKIHMYLVADFDFGSLPEYC